MQGPYSGQVCGITLTFVAPRGNLAGWIDVGPSSSGGNTRIHGPRRSLATSNGDVGTVVTDGGS